MIRWGYVVSKLLQVPTSDTFIATSLKCPSSSLLLNYIYFLDHSHSTGTWLSVLCLLRVCAAVHTSVSQHQSAAV